MRLGLLWAIPVALIMHLVVLYFVVGLPSSVTLSGRAGQAQTASVMRLSLGVVDGVFVKDTETVKVSQLQFVKQRSEFEAEPEPETEPFPELKSVDEAEAIPAMPPLRPRVEPVFNPVNDANTRQEEVEDTAAVDQLAGKTGQEQLSSEALSAGSGVSGLGNGAVQTKSYRQRLMALLEKHKIYPRRAKLRRREGVVGLYLRLAPNGEVLETRIVRPTGIKSLDKEAVDLIHRAVPLPPPPGGKVFEYRFNIRFELLD